MRWLLVGLALGAFLMEQDKKSESAKEELMQADRAFYKATSERRLEGWMEFYTEDAVRIAPIGGQAHVGHKAIRELDSKLLGDPAVELHWEPKDAGAFRDGKHGFTTGMSKLVRKKDGGEESLGEYAYVTFWRKEDGKWKVILDTGAKVVKE